MLRQGLPEGENVVGLVEQSKKDRYMNQISTKKEEGMTVRRTDRKNSYLPRHKFPS